MRERASCSAAIFIAVSLMRFLYDFVGRSMTNFGVLAVKVFSFWVKGEALARIAWKQNSRVSRCFIPLLSLSGILNFG